MLEVKSIEFNGRSSRLHSHLSTLLSATILSNASFTDASLTRGWFARVLWPDLARPHSSCEAPHIIIPNGPVTMFSRERMDEHDRRFFSSPTRHHTS